MNRAVVTLVLLLLSIAGVSGQTKDVIEEVDTKLAQLRIDARHADERNEDVEILRRLLNKSLGLPDQQRLLLDPPVAYLTSPRATNGVVSGERVSQAVGPFDGVYLAGRGVVYTLHIPAGVDLTYDPHSQRVGVNAGCNKCHEGITPNANTHSVSFLHSEVRGITCTTCHSVDVPTTPAKPLSEWEQTRMSVRGEKPATPEPKKADKPRGLLCDAGTLTEQIGGQLSAHARNLRYLGEKESITVVVTFDSLPGTQAGGVAPVAKLGLTPDEVQALTLGDLHLKQKKYTEAVEAYLKGLVRFKDTVRLSAPANSPFKDVTAALEEMTTSIRATYKSLAAAYLQLGHLDDAKAALEKATTIKVELAQSGTTGAKPVGPAKLILSVMKTDLGAETAAFKKAIRIDRMNFPTADEKKASK